MKTFDVYQWDYGRWVYWMTVQAPSMDAAGAMVLQGNPPDRFRVVAVR